MKLPGVEEGIDKVFTTIRELGSALKYERIGIPFLGKDDNVEETAKVMISKLMRKLQGISGKKPELVDVVAEKVEQYLALKKAFLESLVEIVGSNKLEIS